MPPSGCTKPSRYFSALATIGSFGWRPFCNKSGGNDRREGRSGLSTERSVGGLSLGAQIFDRLLDGLFVLFLGGR